MTSYYRNKGRELFFLKILKQKKYYFYKNKIRKKRFSNIFLFKVYSILYNKTLYVLYCDNNILSSIYINNLINMSYYNQIIVNAIQVAL